MTDPAPTQTSTDHGRGAPRGPATATYRVPLGGDLTFAALVEVLDAVRDAGISHLHLPPVLRTRAGTPRSADVLDHGVVDPALGGEEGLRQLADAAHQRGLGLLADVALHHVATAPGAPLWERLLAEGRSSPVASHVDVDWEPPLPGATDKVILPVLDEPYGDALAGGLITLEETPDGIRVRYRDQAFPVNAESAQALERSGLEGLLGTAGAERTWQRMHSLLEQQRYRLVSWRAGTRLVNYRRHLDRADLAALRVEDATVFDATHAVLVDLVADGVLDGLWVRHVDEMADPRRYLQRLRERIGPDAWVVVESRALGRDRLPADWPVDGATGYGVLRTLLGIQVDPDGHRRLVQLAADHDGVPDGLARRRMRAEVADGPLGPDLRRCTGVFWAACQEEPTVRDVDYRTLLEAISRLVTAVPGRTYVDPETGQASEEDRRIIRDAVALARGDGGPGDVPDRLWAHLQALLLGGVRWSMRVGEAVTRFQQLTAPVDVLGREDQLLHRHQALVAACEIGCDPDDVPRTLQRAHEDLAAVGPAGLRVIAAPDLLLGEDTRLRIAALTGLAGAWATQADLLVQQTAPPDRALALRLLQVAVGIWPVADDGSEELEAVLDDRLRERFQAYAIQAARSAGLGTSHRDHDDAAEAAVRSWSGSVLDPHGAIAPTIRPLAIRSGEIAMAAGLAQVLAHLTLPGAPELVPGTAGWDTSLGGVDEPAGETPGDLVAGLDAPGGNPDDLWATRRDGRVKAHVRHHALRVRRDHPRSMGPKGTLVPVSARGRWADHVFAYGRAPQGGTPEVVVIAPRIFGRITDGGRFDPCGRIWADTDVVLPGSTGWTDVLSGHTVESGTVAAAAILQSLPVALLVAGPAVGAAADLPLDQTTDQPT